MAVLLTSAAIEHFTQSSPMPWFYKQIDMSLLQNQTEAQGKGSPKPYCTAGITE